MPSAYAALIRAAEGAGGLLALQLAVTERCNLRCSHCFWSRQLHPGLELARYRSLLAEAAALGGLFLKITGGEPLLRPDLLDIVGAARAQAFAVSIDTNGTLLSPALGRALGELGLLEVGVSLHAADAASHERITGVRGSFDAALAGIRTLRSNGIRVRIKCSVLAEAAGGWRGLPALAARLGCSLSLDPLIFPREGAPADAASSAALASSAAPSDEQEEALRLQHAVEGAAGSKPSPRSRSADGPAPAQEDPGARPPCGAGTWSVDVRPDGEVRPCTQWARPLGDVCQESLVTIWARTRREVGPLRRDAVCGCSQCEHFARCGQCPALQERLQGDWRTPTPLVCRRAALWHRIRTTTPGTAHVDEPGSSCDH